MRGPRKYCEATFVVQTRSSLWRNLSVPQLPLHFGEMLVDSNSFTLSLTAPGFLVQSDVLSGHDATRKERALSFQDTARPEKTMRSPFRTRRDPKRPCVLLRKMDSGGGLYGNREPESL